MTDEEQKAMEKAMELVVSLTYDLRTRLGLNKEESQVEDLNAELFIKAMLVFSARSIITMLISTDKEMPYRFTKGDWRRLGKQLSELLEEVFQIEVSQTLGSLKEVPKWMKAKDETAH